MTVNDLLNTAVAHHREGRLAEAERIYRDILRQHPDHPAALYFLGRVAASTGHLDHAATLLSRASQLDPTNADCLGVLGEVLAKLNRRDDAIAAYRAAVALRPDWVEALNNLGQLLHAAGRSAEAIDAYRQAIRHRPDVAQTHANLAESLRSAGHWAEAADAARAAVRLNDHLLDGWTTLALALSALRQRDEAVAAFNRALALSPPPAVAAQIHTNRGATLLSIGKLDDAIDGYRAAIAFDPGLATAHSNLGTALLAAGDVDAAIAAFDAAIAVSPGFHAAHSNRLFALWFHPSLTNAQILAEHRAWAARHADPLAPPQPVHDNPRDPGRRLRVGFVSPDLSDHPLGRFMIPILERHDPARLEIICYSATAHPDHVTARLRAGAAAWRDVTNVPHAALAELIRADRVDVLVDLSLHSAGNALPAFARKPAPVQVTYLAYAGTSGMRAMDFRLTDPHLDPPDARSDANYTERSRRLPRTYWCYADPPADAPDEIAPPPSRSSGHITFGCLNTFTKASPPARAAWARILQQIPNSRLILHALPGRHRARVENDFAAAAGVDRSRVEWLEKLPTRDYFAAYNRIDVALDPWPFNGGTTTCDALWMGVPVVTLAGDRAVARGGVSILTNVGLPELIARDVEDYVRIAVDLARDADRLVQLRASMRQRMRAAPLMDAESFAGDFEEVIRSAWRAWCDGGSAGVGAAR